MGSRASTSVSRSLTVGEASARSGVAVSALHYYEDEGLIRSWRTAGNQRRYERDVLRRLAIIKIAKRAGVPLAEIRDALATLPQARTPTAADWRTLASHWCARLDARIRDLEALRDQIDGCIGCGCLSLASCPLRNPGDVMSETGPGARAWEERDPS